VSLRFLITGTGHCGTGYVSQLLRSVGVVCGHEKVFGPDGVLKEELHWRDLQANSGWPDAAFIDHPVYKDAKLYHVVRHPLRVIESFLITGAGSVRTWMHAYIDVRLNGHPWQLLAERYLAWNRLIEKHNPIETFRVEMRTDILKVLDIPGDPWFDDTRYNTRRQSGRPAPRLDWQLLAEHTELETVRQLEAMAYRYGYLQ